MAELRFIAPRLFGKIFRVKMLRIRSLTHSHRVSHIAPAYSTLLSLVSAPNSQYVQRISVASGCSSLAATILVGCESRTQPEKRLLNAPKPRCQLVNWRNFIA